MSGTKDDGSTFDLPLLIKTVVLERVMPRCPVVYASTYAKALSLACREREITTPKRLASFLGHLAWESGDLRYWTELADGTAYEGRKSLGNTEPGDGPRFKGRGPIQLTGRANYTAASTALGVDLIARPELVLDPSIGCRVAAWFWWSRGLSTMADADPLSRLITKRINGAATDEAPSHHLKRLAIIKRALVALGVS